MIGTSDQSCWLAEACKILLLHTGTLNYLHIITCSHQVHHGHGRTLA